MLKKIAAVLGVLLLGFVGFVASRPAAFKYERQASIAAPPAVVYAQVADFRAWEKWSPWEKLDPAMKKTHSGATTGVGAAYEWAGNSDVGEGRMTVTEAVPATRLGIKLEFLKPFAATNRTTFTFTPQGGGTGVSWAMEGENNFMSKAFGVFVDMDKMIGSDFEKGLAQLKTVAEAEAQKQAVATPAPEPAASPAPAGSPTP